MAPTLEPDEVIVAIRNPYNLTVGNVVIAEKDGREVIKRVSKMKSQKVYIVGDNSSDSSDSRNYGWLERSVVVAKVIWPRLSR